MSDFIQGDDFDRPGGDAEEMVWKSIKSTLSKRETLGYSRYPLFSGEGGKKKEPDILLLDKELGVITIEVKGFNIQDIEEVLPNRWTMNNSYSRTVNPIAQAEDYLYALKGKLDIDRELRGKYKGKVFVALPYIDSKEFIDKGFLKELSEEIFIFRDDLKDKRLLDKLTDTKNIIEGVNFSNDGYRIAKSILGHEQNHVEDVNINLPEGTKAAIYNKVKNKLYDLDIQQEKIAKTIAPGPQRIRGIAGSGKTLLICQKAAYMHLKHPEWKIVVTFFTQSLYDTITKTLDMYLKAFTMGKVSYDENSNLMVLHAWGRKDKNGLYREIASRNNCRFLNATDVSSKLGGYVSADASINYISNELLKETKGNLEEIFDAILIDEGQDLIGDNKFKYEGKQPFYYMAYKSLKKVNSNEEKDLRRLVWAYDELQSLNDTKIPSSKEIFGDSSLITGIYKGGMKKSEIMKKCYRTPHQILTSAHAIGMGFYRKEGILSGYTTKEDWENIGYNVVGDFRKVGSEIVLERPLENSPNPINNCYSGNFFEFKKYSNEIDMIRDLANNIKADIDIQKLNASRDILIINLKESFKGREYSKLIGKILNEKGINYYTPGCGHLNILKEIDYRNNRPDRFWVDGAITIAPIIRAKGNEAAMVYIVGVEDVAANEASVASRNKLFTALTRAKCWVKLMGVGSYSLYSEIEKAIESNGKFRFIYRKPKKDSNDEELD